jgi:hypothetical protein
VKALPSSPANEVLTERAAVIHLPVSVWEEEMFAAPVHEGRTRRLEWNLTEWENIEAVGAADDATRFQIDFQTADSCKLHP